MCCNTPEQTICVVDTFKKSSGELKFDSQEINLVVAVLVDRLPETQTLVNSSADPNISQLQHTQTLVNFSTAL